jgi:hypothetical protein
MFAEWIKKLLFFFMFLGIEKMYLEEMVKKMWF